MITINSNEEAEKLIKDGVLEIEDDLEITFDRFKIEADIKCHNIYSKDIPRDITAWDIKAEDINAGDITARNINAWNITARDIKAGNINAVDLNVRDIKALNITARNINVRNITYHAVCFAYQSFRCTSIKGKRENAKHFCLDKEIEFKKV